VISLDVQGFEAVERLLRPFAARELDDALRHLEPLLVAQTRRRLQDTKTAPDGTPWAPWAPSTARRALPGQSLLERTGQLRDQLEVQEDSQAVEIGSDLVRAAVLSEGRPSVGMPARPLLGLSPRDEEEIVDAIDTWLARRLEGR
jgi:phage virion morphogenesis protein